MIRAKFSCYQVTKQPGGSHINGKWTPGEDEWVTLSAVAGGPGNENEKWSAATPAGQLTMTISNPGAQGFFQIGKSYFLTLEEAPS